MFDCLPQNKRHRGGFSISRKEPRHDDDSEHIGAKLNELSLEERSKLEFELHGVADVEEEDPALLAARVEEMDQELSDRVFFSGDDTSAYEAALVMSKEYVDDFKILFLRAEAYNGREAAARMIRFFDRKRHLFGEETLTRDIRLSDFEDEEMEALRQGVFMMLPQRDRSGRSIVAVNGRVNIMYSTHQVMRVVFYVLMMAAQDEEGAQKRGIVAIYHGFGQPHTIQGRAFEFWKIWRALPSRIVACHYCGDDSKALGPAVRQFCAIAERLTVCRIRCHYGPQIECMYKLMTFGIPVTDAMPITVDGRIDLTLHHQMIREWQAREEGQLNCVTLEPLRVVSPVNDEGDDVQVVSPLPGTYVVAGNLDILMGRGRHPKSSPGSIHLHDMLRQHRAEYDRATKSEKTALAGVVLDKLKRIGCRFIKLSPGGYQVCEDSLARGKISHGFRNLRLKDAADRDVGGNGKPVKRSFDV
mmetsp:Transcript_60362/g.90998  ORF Transcript_60362/g.90998 Transcript_60362/m.90998 type:complete len:472 (+) Transcript_60362:71-1486(+)|eukprot:CAMPEP_0117014424 /NCGR_PEP_ID=MMETSP0472-20121206/11703_1 /TAXON_ID=693140 ORGANISM="Tiarina fusus, Strain LIS" /NCGR_SAMPLE_ID=MMETSP0472 /ASSEMBLY_ACC=CAM_ASM_000603 /LENGTH=471 /DNA_ID=CAMNT_0004717977 /DNA_START=69 /DNA_END=1484 /DNA_ORIENTATION=-